MKKTYNYEIKLGKNKFSRNIEGVNNLMAVNELISLIADHCNANGVDLDYSYTEIEDDDE